MGGDEPGLDTLLLGLAAPEPVFMVYPGVGAALEQNRTRLADSAGGCLPLEPRPGAFGRRGKKEVGLPGASPVRHPPLLGPPR